MHNIYSLKPLTNIIDTFSPKPDFTKIDIDEFRESIYLIIDDFVKNNYQLFGADQNGEDYIEKSDYDKKIVLCLGGESEGFNE